ncbi:unnamed protein product [Vitrella brassicaformis CCMP3155]|uniref:Thioredoxin domain-containing protein n=1 Tax=Vitrella brassicaformis (strain CCMP3155) TaxID=1169540 RepID=A0A0G4ELG2_VITBC|nr:unnamed protein product [Vitrella brassicaformis CCMP3155]|eukprot:CEL98253.1 unnamed protein product [Vitrella brassicaformis CCMP3155]
MTAPPTALACLTSFLSTLTFCLAFGFISVQAFRLWLPAAHTHKGAFFRSSTIAMSNAQPPTIVSDVVTDLSRAGAIKSATGEAASIASLQGKSVALYFAAGWCPMCQSFTPVLRSFYQRVNTDGQKIEVIFVSSDGDNASQAAHMEASHGPWLRIDYDDPLTDKLKRQHGVWARRESHKFEGMTRRAGVPGVVVIGSDGHELQFMDTERKGGGALDQWDFEHKLWE